MLCPVCRKPLGYDPATAGKDVPAWFPFCCERCKMVDLGRWFTEAYRISRPATPDDGSPPSAEDAE